MANSIAPRWFERLLTSTDELKHLGEPVFSGLKPENMLLLFEISTKELPAARKKVFRDAIKADLHNVPNTPKLHKMFKTLASLATEMDKKFAYVPGTRGAPKGDRVVLTLRTPAATFPRSPIANHAATTFAPQMRAKKRTLPQARASVNRMKRPKKPQARPRRTRLRPPQPHLPLGRNKPPHPGARRRPQQRPQQRPPKRRTQGCLHQGSTGCKTRIP